MSRVRAQAISKIRAQSAAGIMAPTLVGFRVHPVAVIRAPSRVAYD